MRRFMMPLICSALMLGSAPTSAQNIKWRPQDFTGTYVSIFDRAENGCWTNIGETKEYAEDQLELAGFKVADPPQNDLGSAINSQVNAITLVIDVKGIRWPDGMCVGSLTMFFVGRVILLEDQSQWVSSTIGMPAGVPLWDEQNFNTIVLDHTKTFIASWVTKGIPSAKAKD